MRCHQPAQIALCRAHAAIAVQSPVPTGQRLLRALWADPDDGHSPIAWSQVYRRKRLAAAYLAGCKRARSLTS